MPLVELNLSAERNRTKPSMFALVLYQPGFLYVIHLGHWDAVFRKKKKKMATQFTTQRNCVTHSTNGTMRRIALTWYLSPVM